MMTARARIFGDMLPVKASANELYIWYDTSFLDRGLALAPVKPMGAPRSSRLKMKTMMAPAASPGRKRGKVTVLNSLNPFAPRFSACSSTLGSMLFREARTFRNTMG